MTSLRRLRTQRALAVAVLLAVAVPMLSSCGFNYATNRPNVIADGGYSIFGDVKVLAARVVAPSQGTGTFVATIAVDANAKDVKLTGLSGEGLTVGQFQPIEVPAGGAVNLFTSGGIPVTGSFGAGDNVPVTLTFDNGDSIDVGAKVVKQCHEYSDVQTLPTKQTREAQQEPAEPYTCEYPSVPPLAEGH